MPQGVIVRCTRWVVVCLLPLFARGQSGRVETLSIRDGLSQGFVSTHMQDREGFLWIGTKNGLNRYDGRHFKIFSADPSNPHSLSNDYILSLHEYGDFILVGTNGGGLNIFHKKTQRFYRMPRELPDGGQLFSPLVFAAFVDQNGQIWLHLWKENTYLNGPVFRLQLPPGFWERLPEATDPWAGVSISSPSTRYWQTIYLNKARDAIWMSENEALARLETGSGRLDSFHLPGTAERIIEDPSGRIWAFCNSPALQMLLRLDAGVFREIKADFPIDRFYGFDLQHRLMLGSAGNFVRLPAGHVPEMLRIRDADLRLPKAAGLRSIIDRSGIVWLSTLGYGLFKLSPQTGRFRTLFEDASIYSPPFVDTSGLIGYFPLGRKGPETYPPDHPHPLKKVPATGYNHRYQRDRNGRHWLWHSMGNKHRLIRLDASGNIEKQYFERQTLQMGACIGLDAEGRVQVAHNGKLIRVNSADDRTEVFDYSSVLPYGHEVRAMAQTANGYWWFATDFGLLQAIPENGSFKFSIHQQNPADPDALRNENIACLLVDPADAALLWMGTKGGGLECLDTRSGKVRHLSTKNGLPNDVIYGLLDDSAGNLWMSSNRGLIRYHPASGSIKNFTEADGLLSDEFNTWAYAKAPNGELLFGGVKGLHIFDPKNWTDNAVPPPVFITDLTVNNIPLSAGDSTGLLTSAPEWTGRIVLPYGQNSIALTFAALEFTAPSKNRFRYYLEGAEPAWVHEGYDATAQYLNLQPGTYTFKVMACNNDGVWNPRAASLQIVVLPPWYRSWWAWLLYALLAAVLVAGYMRFRINRLRLQQQLAIEHLRTERLREMDEFKSRFFTNISHEFRTPLTVILGSAAQAEQQLEQWQPKAGKEQDGAFQILKNKLDMVRRSGQNLLQLVNQILDLAKLESRTLTLQYVRGDVIPYLRYVAESLHSVANAKNILLRVDTALPALEMDYEPERLLQIVYNLLSNAIKYTPSGGRVVMKLAIGNWKSETGHDANPQFPMSNVQFQISISDTGIGIPPDDLPFIFDRFFRAGNQHLAREGGAGIGLALTRELVEAMKGDIAVESSLDTGTTFTVTLPVSTLAPEAGSPVPEIPAVTVLLPPEARLAPATENADRDCILLIEDNPDVVAYLESCLSDRYRLEYAYNGHAGIERALEIIPDLIVSDVMMPEKDGFEVCEALRLDERSSHIPIVLLTARATVEDRIAGLRRGADAYLAKPFHPEELHATLHRLLEMRQNLRARYASGGDLPPAATETERVEDVFLQKIRAEVGQRLSDSNFSGEELCRALGMSYPVVYRKLSALTGRSLNVYIRLIRLQNAREMLLSTTLGIAEIAYATGFNDPKFFSRVFSEEFGVSPSVFRSSAGK